MLIKWFRAKAPMPFRRKVTLQIWGSVALALLGAGALTVMLCVRGWDAEHFDGFKNGFYTGFGGGLMGAGAVTAIRCALLLRDPVKYKAAEIAWSDERERFLVGRTFSLAGYVMLFALFAATIIAGVCSDIVFATLLCTLGAFGVILLFSHILVKRLY